MKKTVAVLHFVAFLTLWNVAEASVYGRGAASGLAARATTVLRERESFEARTHAQLTRWCNATLPAQESRRSALQHLLVQAQMPQGSESAGMKEALTQLEAEAASIGGELEKKRLEDEASHSAHAKEMAALQLTLDDATRDVEALQRTIGRLGGAATPGVQAATALLAQAKEAKRQSQQQVVLLQSHSGSEHSANLSQLESQYRNKKADIVSYQHQFYTTQRSLDVLTSALEDESGYLADLQSICGAESRVHQRLESHVLPMLRNASVLAAVEGAHAKQAAVIAVPVVEPKPQEHKAEVQQSSPKSAVSKVDAKPVSVPAKKVVTTNTPAPKAVVKAAPSKPAEQSHATLAAIKTKPQKRKLAALKTTSTKKAAALPAPVAPKPLSHKHSKKTNHKKATLVAAPTQKPVATKSAPHEVSAPKPRAATKLHRKQAKVATPTTPAPTVAPKTQDPFEDDDDDASGSSAPLVPQPAPKPAAKQAAHVKKAKVAAPKPAAAKPAPVVKDPFEDDDDDTSTASVAPVPKPATKPAAKQEARVKKAKAAAPKPAPAVKDPFEDDDDDTSTASVAPVPKPAPKIAPKPPAPPESTEASSAPPEDDSTSDDDVALHQKPKKHHHASAAQPPPPPAQDDTDAMQDDAPPPAPPPAPHGRKHGAHKAAKAVKPQQNAFLDGVYDSAAGNMPSAYSAWKPDGAAPEAPTAAPKSTAGADAKKAMMSMLGTDSDDDASSIPAPTEAKPPQVKVAAPAKPVVAPAATDDTSASDTSSAKTTETRPTAPVATDDAAKTTDTVDVSDDAPPPKPAKKKSPTVAAVQEDTNADDEAAVAEKAARKSAKAAEAAFDSDDDSFDAKAAFEAAKPKTKSTPPADDSDDELPVHTAAKPKAKPMPPADDDDDELAVHTAAKPKAKLTPPADDDDDVLAVHTAAKPKAKSMPPADDDDDELAVRPSPPAKKSHTSAIQEDFDSDDSVDTAEQAPKKDQSASQLQLPKGGKHKKAKKDDMDGIYDAAAGKLPTQYSAWSPSEQAASSEKRKTALAEMEADFDDDDDAPPTPAPKKKHRRHHSPPAPPPAPPPPKPAADGVVYDDDDLPKHHQPLPSLEGGWQAFMHKTPAKPKARVDPDVAIMQSLYSKDGGLPSQYTAWTPDDAPKPAAPPPPAKEDNDKDDSDSGGTMDLEKAAKEFAKDPDSAFDFLQLSSEDNDVFSELIHRAATQQVPTSFRGASLLEASSVSVDLSRMAAASIVLEQYAEVLQSKPLKQLAKAKLSPTKLQALYQQLRNVDPMVSNSQLPSHGKQVQAEQMCQYFQEHMQAAAPVQKAVTLVETASNDLAAAVSSHAAIQEEVDARSQLQKTVAQDMSSLTTLVDLAKQGEDASSLVLLEQDLTGAAADDISASVAGVEGAHAELQDLLDLALQKRTAVLQAQRQKLVQLQASAKAADEVLAQKKSRAATSQAAIDMARKKISGITKSCDATMDALARRRHAGHMEAHAIEVALKVLGSA